MVAGVPLTDLDDKSRLCPAQRTAASTSPRFSRCSRRRATTGRSPRNLPAAAHQPSPRRGGEAGGRGPGPRLACRRPALRTPLCGRRRRCRGVAGSARSGHPGYALAGRGSGPEWTEPGRVGGLVVYAKTLALFHAFAESARRATALACQVRHVGLAPREAHGLGLHDGRTGDDDGAAVDRRFGPHEGSVFAGDLKARQGFPVAGNQPAAHVAEDDAQPAPLGCRRFGSRAVGRDFRVTVGLGQGLPGQSPAHVVLVVRGEYCPDS